MTLISSLAPLAIAVSGVLTDAPVPQDIRFDVYRNGSPMGAHEVTFSRTDAGDLRVDIDIELSVRFGPIQVFRYEHDATEFWRNGDLVAVQAATFSDGEWTRWQAGYEAAPRIDFDALPPSSHWLGYDTALSAILNTETGEPMDVVIEAFEPAPFDTGAGSVLARRVRMTGSLTVDLWYDEAGNWVGCEFEARGQTIRYVLAT